MANVQSSPQRGHSTQPRKRASKKIRVEDESLYNKETDTASRNLKDLQQPNAKDESIEADKTDLNTFEFVTITRLSDATNSEVSKIVRTQAMRDYLRKQNRQAITGVTEVVTSVQPEEPAQYKGRFKLNTWSHKTKTKAINARREKGLPIETTAKKTNRKARTPENSDAGVGLWRPDQHQSPNPVLFLDGRQLDPFDSLSIKLGRRSEGLLVHYHHSYSMNSVAINSDGDFFSHAKTDPALLHSILYLVALHHDLTFGISDSPEALYHGGEAFRAINQRLQDGVFSDMTIAAVAMLATKDNLNGNYEASKIHMHGLEYMVKQRGGIHKIKGVLGRVVTWSDLCYANVWNCQPRFPRMSLQKRRESSDFDILDFDSTLLAPEDLFDPKSPTISIISHLRKLSSLLDPDHSEPLDRKAASDMIYSVEYDLLQLNKEHADDLEPNEYLYSFEAIPMKTAAHLWLYLVIREIPRTSRLLHRLVERLQDALEFHLGGWWNWTYERQTWLLWMLFMGGAASAGRYERWWFVKEMRIACRILGIWNLEGVEGALKRVLWQDTWCKHHVSSLWNDVLMMEETEGGSLSPEDWQLDQYSPGLEVEIEEEASY